MPRRRIPRPDAPPRGLAYRRQEDRYIAMRTAGTDEGTAATALKLSATASRAHEAAYRLLTENPTEHELRAYTELRADGVTSCNAATALGLPANSVATYEHAFADQVHVDGCLAHGGFPTARTIMGATVWVRGDGSLWSYPRRTPTPSAPPQRVG